MPSSKRRTSPPAFVEDEHAVVVTNADGSWTIRKRHDAGTNAAGPGPGYISKFELPDGTVIVEDPEDADGTVNDPRYGGLGCFGMHVARQNEFFRTLQVVNYTWDVTGRHHAATRGGYGVGEGRIVEGPRRATVAGRRAVQLGVEVDFFDGESWPGRPLVTVRYDYVFWASRVQCHVAVTTGPGAHAGSPAFVKEPKVVCHSLGSEAAGSPVYRYVDIYRRDGSLIERFDIWALPDPTLKTKQWGYNQRARLRFDDPERGNHYFNIVAEGLGPGEVREDWEGSAFGLDHWAQLANAREMLEPVGERQRYCLQGPDATLTRQWETARWAADAAGTEPQPGRPQTGIMLHAWEGGSGYPDCRCCYRRFGPRGESFGVYLCFSYGDGWVV
ncbi:MAG TPA: hypothetical protein VFR32_02905 [Gaiellaceae bacterium]|nr:hypothetical protein [Gaiellaceae bacterium]